MALKLIRKTKAFLILLTALAVIAGVVIFAVIKGNNVVLTKQYSIYSEKLNTAINGYRIVQISDFHNSKNYEKVLDRIKKARPNLVVITGDIVTKVSGSPQTENVEALLDGLKEYPVYFSSGNHESTWTAEYDYVMELLKEKGVTVLDGDAVEIHYNRASFNLAGFRDSVYSESVMRYDILTKQLDELYSKIQNKELFTVLLFHRASLLDSALSHPYDLILSGHTHGGVIGIPPINKWIVKTRYRNADYIKGYYRNGITQIIVSGGLSSSWKEPRINNKPEISVINLYSTKK